MKMDNMLSNSAWLKKFLTDADRGCESGPNGKPLYSYRCTKEEFEQLKELLKKSEKIIPGINIPIGYSIKTEELFVLYCSEWWRRCYNGGSWKWAPIIESLEWKYNDWKQRTEFVRKGLKYWKRDLLKLESGVQYLTSVATEGGIPINVLEKHGAVFKRYLKSVLKGYGHYTDLGVSAEGIAKENLSDLPKSWRREQIATLTGQIVEQIWNLHKKITNPLAPSVSLDENYPGWEKTLPLSLDSVQSKTLINSLLMSAQDVQSSKINRIRLERFLEKGLDGWELKAELLLPKRLDGKSLASFGMTETANLLPDRMDMYHQVDEERFLIARLTKGNDESWSIRPISNANLKFKDNVTKRHEVILVERGKLVDSMPVIGGEELNDLLPQCFIADDDELEQFKWVSQGSCKRKDSSIYVLTEFTPEINDSLSMSSVNKIDDVFDKKLWEVNRKIYFKSIENEICLIEPGLDKISERDYRLTGPAVYFPKTRFPLYNSVPVVQQIDEASVYKIPEKDLFWRAVGKKQWQPIYTGNPQGDIEIRHMEDSVSLASWKVSILPKNSLIKMEPESQFKGSILLSGLGTSRVYCETNTELKVTYLPNIHTGDIKFEVVRKNISITKLFVIVEWDNGCKIRFDIPFPAQGGTFVSTDTGADLNKIVLSRLYTYHAQVVDPLGDDSFTLKGSLCSKSVTHTEAEIHGFEYPLFIDESGFYSLPLQQLKPEIEQLFAISTAVDDVVKLELCGKQSSSKKIFVHQFEGELRYESEIDIIHLQLNGEWLDEYYGVNLKLISVDDLELEPIILPWNEIRNGWTIPDRENFDNSKTYFASVDNENCYLIRPCIIESQISDNELINSELTRALLISKKKERIDSINAYIEKQLEQNNPDFSEIIAYLKRFSMIHPDGLDLVECLLNYPKVMSILWLYSTSDKSLNDYLNLICETSPFSWWMISIKDWLASVELWLNSTINKFMSKELEEVFISSARKEIHNLIDEHEEINASMELVLEKLNEHYRENSAIFYARHHSDEEFWSQIINYAKLTPHPDGIDKEWPVIPAISKMIELIPQYILKKINWPNDDYNFKQPILAAPIFAAIFLNNNIKLDEQLRVSLMAARNFDKFSFSIVFRGTQANLWVYSGGDKND